MLSKRKEKDADRSTDTTKKMRVDDPMPKLKYENQLPSPGIIEEVKLFNFMSHGQLHFNTFGEHVNFLLGLNGSGKSAVLTGIMVALGGKATATSRGSSLKLFVKHGKRVAEASVRLRNCGPDAYSHGIYGDSITIARRITDGGVSSYRIADASSHTISTQREELDRILDHFNIQVDNPVVILNQSVSREFLLEKKPADMYRFFMKATQLQQLVDEYEAAEEAREVTRAELREKRHLLQRMQSDVNEWQQKYAACAKLEMLRGKIDRFKEEMAWAFVVEKERGLENVEKELQAEEVRKPVFIRKVEESDERVKAAEAEMSRIQEELKCAADDTTSLESAHVKKKTAVRDGKSAVKTAQDSLRRLENEIRGNEADQEVIKQRIDEMRGTEPTNYDALRRERERKIAALAKQASDLAAQMSTTEVGYEHLRSAHATAQRKVEELKSEESSLREVVSEAERTLRELVASRGNELRRFGAWMPELVRRLDDAHRRGVLRQKPRGPIGAHLKLRDRRWTSLVERCLGQQVLTAFCINDYDDEREFLKIAASVCGGRKCVPTNFTSRFFDRVHNAPTAMTSGLDPAKYRTVLEVLEIADPVIANCLIDQKRIEYLLLSDDLDDAIDLMMHNPPRNYKQVFVHTNGELYSLHSTPCFRSYAEGVLPPARYLSVNVEEVIRDRQAKCDRLRAEHRGKTEQLSEAQTEAASKNRDQQRSASQLQELKKCIVRINTEILELRDVEDPAPIDVRTLEDEVRILDGKQAELLGKRADARGAVVVVQTRLKELEEELRAIEGRIRSAVEKLDPGREHLTAVDNELDRARQAAKHYRQKMKDFEGKLEALRKRRDTAAKDLEESMAKATEVCAERVRTRRTPHDIEAEIVQLELQMATERSNRGDPVEILKTLVEKRKQFDHLEREVSQLNAFLEKLKSMLLIRNEHYLKLRESVTGCIKMRFQCHLKMGRNFDGSLEISHKKRTLTPVIHPTATPANSASVRGLSGGERSFAMTCLILALWDWVESPFRCLDEFDIFMDLWNRRRCMEMMLEAAECKPNCQFVFLSPLNMSQLKLSSDTVRLKVMEMAAPVRESRAS